MWLLDQAVEKTLQTKLIMMAIPSMYMKSNVVEIEGGRALQRDSEVGKVVVVAERLRLSEEHTAERLFQST